MSDHFSSRVRALLDKHLPAVERMQDHGEVVLPPQRNGRKPYFTGQILDQLLKDRDRPVKDLAEQFECSVTTVSKTLLENGIRHQPGPASTITKRQATRMLRLYKKGRSLEWIANRFGLNTTTVRNRIAKTAEIRKKGGWSRSFYNNSMVTTRANSAARLQRWLKKHPDITVLGQPAYSVMGLLAASIKGMKRTKIRLDKPQAVA